MVTASERRVIPRRTTRARGRAPPRRRGGSGLVALGRAKAGRRTRWSRSRASSTTMLRQARVALRTCRPPPIEHPERPRSAGPAAPSPSRGRPRLRSAGRRGRCPACRQRPGERSPTTEIHSTPRHHRGPSGSISNARAVGHLRRPSRRTPHRDRPGVGHDRAGKAAVVGAGKSRSHPSGRHIHHPAWPHPGQGHLRLTPASTGRDRSTVSDDLDPATAEARLCGGRPPPARPEAGPMAVAIDHLVGPQAGNLDEAAGGDFEKPARLGRAVELDGHMAREAIEASPRRREGRASDGPV